MSEEEMQRKMEFIVNQQAQFTTDIQQMKEERDADAKLWREKYNSLTDAMTTVVEIVGTLAEAQKEAAEASKQTSAKLAELAAKQAETDERLNIFINVVERYISRNGRTPDSNSGESAPSTRAAMKRSGHLWPQITDFANLTAVARQAQRGKRTRPNVLASTTTWKPNCSNYTKNYKRKLISPAHIVPSRSLNPNDA